MFSVYVDVTVCAYMDVIMCVFAIIILFIYLIIFYLLIYLYFAFSDIYTFNQDIHILHITGMSRYWLYSTLATVPRSLWIVTL